MKKLIIREDREEGQIISTDAVFVFGRNKYTQNTYNGWYIAFNGFFVRRLIDGYIDYGKWEANQFQTPEPTLCYFRAFLMLRRPLGRRLPKLYSSKTWSAVE